MHFGWVCKLFCLRSQRWKNIESLVGESGQFRIRFFDFTSIIKLSRDQTSESSIKNFVANWPVIHVFDEAEKFVDRDTIPSYFSPSISYTIMRKNQRRLKNSTRYLIKHFPFTDTFGPQEERQKSFCFSAFRLHFRRNCVLPDRKITWPFIQTVFSRVFQDHLKIRLTSSLPELRRCHLSLGDD